MNQYIERIKKLLVMAERAAGNEVEAATAFRIANLLMAKHSVHVFRKGDTFCWESLEAKRSRERQELEMALKEKIRGLFIPKCGGGRKAKAAAS